MTEAKTDEKPKRPKVKKTGPPSTPPLYSYVFERTYRRFGRLSTREEELVDFVIAHCREHGSG